MLSSAGMTTRVRGWLVVGTMCSLGALHCGGDDPASPAAASGGTSGAGAKAGAAGIAGSGQTTAGTGGTNGAAGKAGGAGTAGTSATAGTGGAGGGGGTNATGGSSGSGTAGSSGSGTAGSSGSGTAGAGGSGTAGSGGNSGTAAGGGSNGTAGTAGASGTAGTGASAGQGGSAGSGAAGAGGGSSGGNAGSGGGGPVYPPFPLASSALWVEAGRNTQTGPGGLVAKIFDLGYPDIKQFGLFSVDGNGPTLDSSDPQKPFIDFQASHGLALGYGGPSVSWLDNLSGGFSLYFYVRSTKATDYGPLFDCGVTENQDNFDPLVNRIFFGRAVEDDRLKYLVFNAQGGIAAELTVTSSTINENAYHLIGVAQNAQGAITVTIDGTAVGTPNTPGTLPTSMHRPKCYIGRSLYHNGFQGNQDYDGDLRAVFGFQGVLTPVQQEQLLVYTATRWQ